MDSLLAEMLTEWRKVTRYRSDNDWVFASKRAKGKRPIWGQSIMRKQIHPAIEKLGIKKRIGWHTFRHSYSTLLRNLGTDIKVQQDLLRHVTILSNLEIGCTYKMRRMRPGLGRTRKQSRKRLLR
jgi:site-specific recombinase XerD